MDNLPRNRQSKAAIDGHNANITAPKPHTSIGEKNNTTANVIGKVIGS
jgi:hypothetical protein